MTKRNSHKLSRAAIDELLSKFRPGSVTCVCQLSPLQEGILFETLKNPRGGNYLTQSVYEVDQDLDHETFIAAWRFVCGRHDALRTTFVYDDVPHPVQIVHSTTSAQVRAHDWSSVSADAQADRLERLLREERHRARGLSEIPPVAFDLIRIRAARFRIVWHVHHLLVDAASSAKILDELSLAYASLKDKADLPVLPQPAQFSDYVAWLSDRDEAADIEEWRQVIGDLSEPSPLSCVAPLTGEADHLSRSITRVADCHFAARLSAFAARHHCTVHTLLQAAWALVLASRSGRSDLCWGTVFSGRSADFPRVDDVVGLLINTVPVRTTLCTTEPVGSWLRRLQRTLSTAHRLEHVGLHRIRRASALTGGQGLFETLFQFVPESPPQDEGLARLELRRVMAVEQTGYPLDMSVVLRGELVVHLQFEPARIEEASARQIAAQYVHLLRELADSDDATLLELEMLPAREREQLAAWSRPSSWDNSTATIPALFAEVAREFSDHAAVLGADAVLSYRQLDSQSDIVAGQLTALGVRPETVVGVAMPQATELIPVLVGILKAGGAYLALDLDAPPERVKFILADSGVSLVVAATGHDMSAMPEHCTVLNAASLLAADPLARPRRHLPAVASPDMLAFVTYTSGSTGIPKCVGMTHRNLARIGRHARYIRSGPGRRTLQLAPVGFDVSIEEIWGSLLNGGSVVMPGLSRMDLPDIADLIQRHEVTNVSMTTGLFHQFADEQVDAFRGVDQLIIGGDVARRAQCDKVLARHPALSLVNAYGPTEMTTTTTSEIVESRPHAAVPIGRPISSTTVYVLDEYLRMVPVGVSGQLYAGGTGVTRGYLNDAGLTAERFVPDPFLAVPGARMYATGDFARWLPDGRLEFIGRSDRQVKIRGFRVELGEIEARLAGHPDVLDAVAGTVENGEGLRRLVAYVVPAPGAEVSTASIRSFVAEQLPGYMVPSLVTMLEKMPLTSIGKVDRARLTREAEPARADDASRGASERARSSTERILAAAWRRVLGMMEDPGMEDNFFDLGGDSILSMRVASAARHEGLVMSSTDLFKYQSIGGLASALDAREIPVLADQRPVTGEVRLTPIQRWFLEHYGAQDHYNQSRLLRWTGVVSEDALRRALKALTDHHDALRLRITRDGANWRQWFTATGSEDPLEVHDLRDVPREDLDSVLRNVGDAVQRSLDLRSGPVIRAALMLTGSHAGDLLLLAIHHMSVDLVSWSILLEDLAGAYRSAAETRAITLPAKTASFKAWSDYLHDSPPASDFGRYQGPRGEPSASSALVPADPDAAAGGPGTRSVRLTLSPRETQRFMRATRGDRKVTGQEVLLASAIPALREWGCTGLVPVDLEAHGREPGVAGPDVTRTVGWFTAVYPVTLDTTDVDTFGGYVAQVRGQLQRDPDGALGYGIARYLSGPDGSHRLSAESKVCFNYLSEVGSGDIGNGLFTQEPGTLGAEGCHSGDPVYLLDITTGVEQGRLFVDVAYSGRRWREGTVRAFADSYLGHIRRSIGQLATWEMDRSHPLSWLARLRPASPLLTAPMRQYRVPGVSVATVAKGQVTAWAHGVTGRDGRDVDVHTLFPVGSVAKHLAAIIVLRLCEAGLISLDQPFDDLPVDMSLPAFAGGDPLTVRHLLSHRSGLAADSLDGGLRAVRPAGETYEYLVDNYVMVERMIEQITGTTFAKSLAAHVFDPLGLSDSELLPLYPDVSHFARTAAGHSATGRRYERPRRALGTSADPELWSCAADIARVGADLHRAIARDEGVLLNQASALELLSGLRSGYGLGTVVKELSSRLWIGHPGDGPGYRTIYAIDAYEGHGVVILANGDGATPMFEDLLVELGTDLVMRVRGDLMAWDQGRRGGDTIA
ncbi:MAG TPA: amino acid adenylation domain-containing protein [Streptosporangiaceae bacterium]|nr:amino acid adenylation domain-containing protein [Streptosporangiaceae bacterium]